MRSAGSLGEFEEFWKQFLHRLERTWNKTKAYYGRSPKWGNWSAKIEDQRRQDELLSYLENARGAEEHTVNEITTREYGRAEFRLADGVGVQPDGTTNSGRLEIRFDESNMHVQSEQPLIVTFIPGRIRMTSVRNRGRLYPVPSKHLGRTLDPSDLPAIAEAAVEFYSKKLAEVEAYFVK